MKLTNKLRVLIMIKSDDRAPPHEHVISTGGTHSHKQTSQKKSKKKIYKIVLEEAS